MKRTSAMIWVINSNSNTCKIYEYNKPHAKLDLIKELTHPENKLHNSDLTSDRPGRYKANGGAHGAYSPATDPKENKIDSFMRDVAHELNNERVKNSYDKLILIAPSHMHGMLMHHIDKHVKERIISNIQKDLIHLNDRDLIPILETTPNY